MLNKDWSKLGQVLNSISSINGKEIQPYEFLDETKSSISNKSQVRTALEQHETVSSLENSQNKTEEFSILTALKDKTILTNFIIVMICFPLVSFNYYLVTFYLKYVGGNIFINTLASIFSECIGNFVSGAFQKWTGTKKGLLICYILSMACALPLLFVSKEVYIALSVFSSRFFLEGAF